jgi:hypothetical protein
MRWFVLLLSLCLFPVTLAAAPIPHDLLGYWNGIAHVQRGGRGLVFRLQLALLPDESFHAKAFAPSGEIDVNGTYQIQNGSRSHNGEIEFVPTSAQPHIDAIPNDEIGVFAITGGNELNLSWGFGIVNFDRMPPPAPAPIQKSIGQKSSGLTPSARPDHLR